MSRSAHEPADHSSHLVGDPRFLLRSIVLATDGSLWFSVWMTLLSAVFLVGANAWAHQVADGMIRTNMTDHVSGPAFIIVTLIILRRFARFDISSNAIRTLVRIIRITVLINLVMLVSELFTEFYAGGAHTDSARSLFFGLHGHHALVPWIWTSVGLNVLVAILFLTPSAMRSERVLITACVGAFCAIWIEKGMGLIVPGFIPSTLHEIVEYAPSAIEWKVSAGVWALGLLIYSAAIKIALPILQGQARISDYRKAQA